MLDQGKLVLPAAAVGDQTLGQRPADLAVVERCRLRMAGNQGLPLHLRQEVLGPVDRFGEPCEPGTVAEELRSHGQDCVQPRWRVLLEADQYVDEQLRLLAAVLLGECERLLELVDQDADLIVVITAAE